MILATPIDQGGELPDILVITEVGDVAYRVIEGLGHSTHDFTFDMEANRPRGFHGLTAKPQNDGLSAEITLIPHPEILANYLKSCPST